MSDKLINNKYFIIDNPHKDLFNIAIYYLSENKCKIIIRRLDHDSWGQDLKIKIMDINNNNFEKISLGSCDNNLKMFDIYTNIKLFPIEYKNQIIPKVIIQTSNYEMNRNIYHYNAIISFVELNPEYEYKFFTDNDCRRFLIDNYKDETFYEDIINAFDIIIPGPIKADIFRYAYLYKNGGCYFDCKMILMKPLNNIISENDDIILCNDNGTLSNSIIMTNKNNNLILEILKTTINNISKFNKGYDSRSISGGKTFHNIFNNVTNKLLKNGENIYMINEDINDHENIILKYNYKDYYNNYYDTERDISYLWNNNNFFFKDCENIIDYKFFFYPNDYNDKFKIKHLKYNIFIIQRIDDNIGWGQQLKLKVINTLTDDTYNIFIGNSDDNERPFVIE
jgi:mannosyltransferase OCH1-like enzyme